MKKIALIILIIVVLAKIIIKCSESNTYTTQSVYNTNSNDTQPIEKHQDSVSLKNDSIYASADSAYRIGDYLKAIEYYKLYISKNNQNADVYSDLGNAYCANGEINLALKSYECAIEIDPQHAQAYYNSGNAYREIGNYDLAIRCYQQSIDRDPNNDDAWMNLGLANLKNGEESLAAKYIKKAANLGNRKAQEFCSMYNINWN